MSLTCLEVELCKRIVHLEDERATAYADWDRSNNAVREVTLERDASRRALVREEAKLVDLELQLERWDAVGACAVQALAAPQTLKWRKKLRDALDTVGLQP